MAFGEDVEKVAHIQNERGHFPLNNNRGHVDNVQFLSSGNRFFKLRFKLCKVLNVQRCGSIYMCLQYVWKLVEHPALWGMWKCFWDESSHFYLLHIVLESPPLNWSIFTGLPGHEVSHHVRNSQSRSRAVSQTQTECDWIGDQTPQSWEREPHVLPSRVTHKDLTTTHTLQSEELPQPRVKMWRSEWGGGLFSAPIPADGSRTHLGSDAVASPQAFSC